MISKDRPSWARKKNELQRHPATCPAQQEAFLGIEGIEDQLTLSFSDSKAEDRRKEWCHRMLIDETLLSHSYHQGFPFRRTPYFALHV